MYAVQTDADTFTVTKSCEIVKFDIADVSYHLTCRKTDFIYVNYTGICLFNSCLASVIHASIKRSRVAVIASAFTRRVCLQSTRICNV